MAPKLSALFVARPVPYRWAGLFIFRNIMQGNIYLLYIRRKIFCAAVEKWHHNAVFKYILPETAKHKICQTVACATCLIDITMIQL